MCLDHGNDGLCLKRFGKIGLCAAQAPFEAVQHSLASGKNDNSNMSESMPGFEIAHNLIAIYLGQTDIKYEQSRQPWLWMREPADCLNTIRETDHLIVCAMQADRKDFTYRGRIVNDHHQ